MATQLGHTFTDALDAKNVFRGNSRQRKQLLERTESVMQKSTLYLCEPVNPVSEEQADPQRS